ncbi:MAG: beta-lactamase family protein [Acidimicrobiales bacterium]|nr:beta-lactamase family protein [Acidimicrobiales bacterium]
MIDDAKVQKLLARVHREIDEGLSPAVQIAVAKDGELLVDETIGAPPESRFVVFSATKAFVAGAIWRLLDDGLLKLDEPVAAYIPAFGTNGKDKVTVEHVLTHTGGFPYAPLGPGRWETREKRLEAFGRWRLTSEPGESFTYHPTAGHWVLGELIAEVTGEDHCDAIQRLVTDPLGLPRVLGIGPDDRDGIVESVATGEMPTPDEVEAALGFQLDLAALLPPEVGTQALLTLNEPSVQRIGVPGGGGVMRAADLAMLYQAMLSNSGGLWSPEILRAGTHDVRCALPDMMGEPSNRSLGLIIAGDDGHSARRGMGKNVSAFAFGHRGAGGQLAFADPATGLSVGYATAGLDQNLLRQYRRDTAIASLAADILAT